MKQELSARRAVDPGCPAAGANWAMACWDDMAIIKMTYRFRMIFFGILLIIDMRRD
jgi:hypothetical protein